MADAFVRRTGPTRDPLLPGDEAPTPSAEDTSEPGAEGVLPGWGFGAALIGRLWLSLVTGMLLIATVPAIVLPGWSAHVVVSDSMVPKINTGDVVLSQDRDDYQAGQVIVFDDASRGAMTHRVQSVQGDTLTTKGDANITADSSPVDREDVIGLGRVLVMFAGLPWVWYHTGQWLPLALFVLSLLLSAWAVSRDRPEPAESDPSDSDHSLDSDDSDDSEPRDRRRDTAAWLPTTAVAVAAFALLVNTLPSASAAFSARTTNDTNTWRAAITTQYEATVMADNPYLYLRLNETPPTSNVATYTATKLGTIQRNYQYIRTGSTFAGTFTLGSPSSANLTPTPNTSAQVLVDGACILAPTNQASLANPQTFTIEAWIRSTGTAGGKIIGFESARTGQSGQYDRHLYQDQQGYVHFGIYNNSNTAVTIKSPTPLNDGAWHHVMGVLTGAAGSMRLYVDGVQVPGTPPPNVTAEVFTGWWRVGCGNLSGWPTGTPGLTGQHSFIGFIDEPAVYQAGLTATDAAERWAIGKP